MRHLELSSLRAVLAVVDHGGVGHAADWLNLTQSAVSMQIKRLEETLAVSLFLREGRKLIPTTDGDLLISYARQILAQHDELRDRLTKVEFEGQITFGVPDDLVEFKMPQILKSFVSRYSRSRVNLVSSETYLLKREFERGHVDVMLTTEVMGKGQLLGRRRVFWAGAIGGVAWQQRPLPLVGSDHSYFRPMMINALGRAGIPWETVSNSQSWQANIAMANADLAVHTVMEGTFDEMHEITGLPPMPDVGIYLYANRAKHAMVGALADIVTQAYAD